MTGSELIAPFSLFTYGTLMLAEVMHAVCGASLPAEEAVLAGYGRYRLKDEVYPAIIAEKTASTRGLLYRGIGREMLGRLDTFEGDQYCRKEVQVILKGGCKICCFTYVLKNRYRHLLGDTPWDVDRFRARHLKAFLAGFCTRE